MTFVIEIEAEEFASTMVIISPDVSVGAPIKALGIIYQKL